VTSIADKLANISAIVSAQPQLSGTEREEYDRICKQLHRAEGDLRRARERGDAKKLATAERAIARAKEARATLVHPRVGHLWAPARIIGKFESRWSGRSGGSGIHRQECEMVLDYKDLSGPHYRTVRVLRDENGPPTNPRGAPDSMGVAWFALAGQIAAGKIDVLSEGTS
jgi:hypothetical protein